MFVCLFISANGFVGVCMCAFACVCVCILVKKKSLFYVAALLLRSSDSCKAWPPPQAPRLLVGKEVEALASGSGQALDRP